MVRQSSLVYEEGPTSCFHASSYRSPPMAPQSASPTDAPTPCGPSTCRTTPLGVYGCARPAHSMALVTASARQGTVAVRLLAESTVRCPVQLPSSQSHSTTISITSTSPSLMASMCPWTSCPCRPTDRKGKGAARGRAAQPTSHRSAQAH